MAIYEVTCKEAPCESNVATGELSRCFQIACVAKIASVWALRLQLD
jgi:hypothetical protein